MLNCLFVSTINDYFLYTITIRECSYGHDFWRCYFFVSIKSICILHVERQTEYSSSTQLINTLDSMNM